MKKYSTIYYLLFVLIVMGTFASMAQNSYGLKITGVACLGFFLTFLHEILFARRDGTKETVHTWSFYAELAAVSVISLVFMLRNFSIDYFLMTPLWISALIVLLAVLSYHGFNQVRVAEPQNKTWAKACVFYYTAVILFILALLSEALAIRVSLLFAIGGILAVGGFLVSIWIVRSNTTESENLSIWEYIRQFKNKSAILLITCLLVYGYNMLNAAGALPPLYHGTLPPAYHELVEVGEQSNDAATRERPRDFKVAYETFVSRYAAKN